MPSDVSCAFSRSFSARAYSTGITFTNLPSAVSQLSSRARALRSGVQVVPFEQDPPYLPIDEEYPGRPESTYSLVKHLEETMAREFTRWDPRLKILGLRFSNVMDPEDYAAFPAFDDVKAQIKQRLEQQKMAEFQQSLIEKAKTDYKFSK